MRGLEGVGGDGALLAWRKMGKGEGEGLLLRGGGGP